MVFCWMKVLCKEFSWLDGKVRESFIRFLYSVDELCFLYKFYEKPLDFMLCVAVEFLVESKQVS